MIVTERDHLNIQPLGKSASAAFPAMLFSMTQTSHISNM
jgi:hypothetical protein